MHSVREALLNNGTIHAYLLGFTGYVWPSQVFLIRREKYPYACAPALLWLPSA
jgi:hypothetical protein